MGVRDQYYCDECNEDCEQDELEDYDGEELCHHCCMKRMEEEHGTRCPHCWENLRLPPFDEPETECDKCGGRVLWWDTESPDHPKTDAQYNRQLAFENAQLEEWNRLIAEEEARRKAAGRKVT